MKEQDVEHEGKLFEKIQFQEKTVTGRKFVDCTFKNCQFNSLGFDGGLWEDLRFAVWLWLSHTLG